MIELEAALRVVRETVQPLAVERVGLEEALGRILRQDVIADIDSPAFDSSAMDGYAVRSPPGPDGFRCLGEIGAGEAREFQLQPGECVRIFTGAKVPAAADRVVMQEYAAREGDLVRVAPHEAPFFIRRAGENCRRGEIVLRAGNRLRPIDLSAIASCGVTKPEVTRRPTAFHLVTGDELVAPELIPAGTQIRDSNSILVRSFLATVGVELLGQVRIRDHSPPDLQVPDCDLLLISGGASVGDRDHARAMLRALGYETRFEKVNLRPGKPTVFAARVSPRASPADLAAFTDEEAKGAGKTGPADRLAFALPGNPVSHWVVLELLVHAAIRRLQGLDGAPNRVEGRLEKEFQCRPDARQTFWPCRAELREGRYLLTPLPFVSSGDAVNTAGANALLPIASKQSSIAAEEPIQFILCEHGF